MTNIHYAEHEISSGSARIVLSVWEPLKPDAVILFIPGTMVHPLFYELLLIGFARRGFAVIGLHPVGHGKSPRDVTRYTIRDIVQNARDAVSFALQKYDLPIMVMGSSQGGIVAAALASEDARITAAFAHNVMLAELPDSIGISRFPGWLRHVYRPMQGLFAFFARIFPDLALPAGFYLEHARISTDLKIWEALKNDPLCLSRYSLCFLSSLFTTRFPGLTDGSMNCSLYVLTDSGDRLFTQSYTEQVFERLKAPHKEMITFHFNDHLLMVTYPQEVCDRLTEIIQKEIGVQML